MTEEEPKPDPKPDPKPSAVVSDPVLRAFVREGFAPVRVLVDGLVAVTMDSRFRVTEVSIRHAELTPGFAKQLERTVQKAVNQAFAAVGKRNSERLLGAMGPAAPEDKEG